MKRISLLLDSQPLPFHTYARFTKDIHRMNTSLKFEQLPDQSIRVRLRKKIILEGKLSSCVEQLEQMGVPFNIIKKSHLRMRQVKGRAA